MLFFSTLFFQMLVDYNSMFTGTVVVSVSIFNVFLVLLDCAAFIYQVAFSVVFNNTVFAVFLCCQTSAVDIDVVVIDAVGTCSLRRTTGFEIEGIGTSVNGESLGTSFGSSVTAEVAYINIFFYIFDIADIVNGTDTLTFLRPVTNSPYSLNAYVFPSMVRNSETAVFPALVE